MNMQQILLPSKTHPLNRRVMAFVNKSKKKSVNLLYVYQLSPNINKKKIAIPKRVVQMNLSCLEQNSPVISASSRFLSSNVIAGEMIIVHAAVK